jgi:hypothetical protein
LKGKGIVNDVQKMSDDSKKDLVIVPKSIIDQLSKKDESDSEPESLKNSIDGLRKMLQTVDNIPSKRHDDGISKGVESHEKQSRAPTKETEVTSKHHRNLFRLPTSGELERAANEPREALKQIEKERVRNQIKDDLNELRNIGRILSAKNVIDSKVRNKSSGRTFAKYTHKEHDIRNDAQDAHIVTKTTDDESNHLKVDEAIYLPQERSNKKSIYELLFGKQPGVAQNDDNSKPNIDTNEASGDSNTLTAERVQGEPEEKTGGKHNMKVETDNIKQNAQGTVGTHENLRDHIAGKHSPRYVADVPPKNHADDHGILQQDGNSCGAIGRGVTNAASWMWETIKSPFT